jgi:SRSO17 transposase
MDASTVERICSDLTTFSAFVFDGCGGRPMMSNLELCVHARLVQAERKTHQPAGRYLAKEAAEADSLRQRMNRATLGSWSCADVHDKLYRLAPHLVPEAFAWIIDDTGFEKKGNKSPGVGRQYSGAVGKVSNCQTVVSTHLAGWTGSLPLEMDLFVPRKWIDDPERCREAGMPSDLVFRSKMEIALSQLDRMLDGELSRGIVLADLGYGKSGPFRQGLRDRGLEYVVGIPENTTVWRPNEGPLPPAPYTGTGRPQTGYQVSEQKPVSVYDLAFELSDEAWHHIELERGRHSPTSTRFACIRVRTSHNAYKGARPGDEEWLVIEWSDVDESPSHYYLSNLGSSTEQQVLAEVAKLRWRVERDYQDLKQEAGLTHYEGRRWHGFHHHLTICMAAMAFLASQRELFPPQAYGVTGVRSSPNAGPP